MPPTRTRGWHSNLKRLYYGIRRIRHQRHLVALIRDKVIENGFTPFYGTCESHSISENVAVNAGFIPAFCEFLVAKAQDEQI